jgi:hypothetical protein
MTRGDGRPASAHRPHRGVYFTCCKVYGRIVLNVQRTAFVGWCPKCAGKREMPVGPDGSDAAFFEAG